MADREPWDVLDRDSGKVRVLTRRCATCIFWRDDRSPISEERTDEIIDGNVAAGALLSCHSTLYELYPGTDPAVCAGFWAKHRQQTAAGRMAEMVLGVVRVEPPSDSGDSSGQPAPYLTRHLYR
jgi:hypothetical protein